MNVEFLSFLKNPEYDFAFCKRLAKNDTPEKSHQSGVNITKPIQTYFPQIDAQNREEYVRLELFLAQTFHDTKLCRYQFQDWGGTRSGERRITRWGDFHNKMSEGDCLIFQRKMYSHNSYRVILVDRNDQNYSDIKSIIEGKRDGVVFRDEQLPIRREEIAEAERNLNDPLETAIWANLQGINRRESTREIIVRSHVFPRIVKEHFGFKCVVTGASIRVPGMNQYEVEAAHIIPKNKNGKDTLVNGLCLSRPFHWAFDKGLFRIDPDGKVNVHELCLNTPENKWINDWNNKQIAIGRDPLIKPSKEALIWHQENVFGRSFDAN
ncbi:HNH endonuclease [Pirellulaceae bacterium]|nr:HNH endonuclease [Pirellulaceae bacterium]